MKMDKELHDWTLNYVKNRDLTFRKLVRFEEHLNKNYIDFEFKDKKQTFFVLDELKDAVFELLKNHEHKVVVSANSEENFRFLIKNWKKFSEYKNLQMIFVNLKLNDKWIVHPHTHAMIADSDSIESGLRTMFDTANGNIAEIKVKKKKVSMFEESNSEEDEGMVEEN